MQGNGGDLLIGGDYDIHLASMVHPTNYLAISPKCNIVALQSQCDAWEKRNVTHVEYCQKQFK